MTDIGESPYALWIIIGLVVGLFAIPLVIMLLVFGALRLNKTAEQRHERQRGFEIEPSGKKPAGFEERDNDHG